MKDTMKDKMIDTMNYMKDMNGVFNSIARYFKSTADINAFINVLNQQIPNIQAHALHTVDNDKFIIKNIVEYQDLLYDYEYEDYPVFYGYEDTMSELQVNSVSYYNDIETYHFTHVYILKMNNADEWARI